MRALTVFGISSWAMHHVLHESDGVHIYPQCKANAQCFGYARFVVNMPCDARVMNTCMSIHNVMAMQVAGPSRHAPVPKILPDAQHGTAVQKQLTSAQALSNGEYALGMSAVCMLEPKVMSLTAQMHSRLEP
eukprot:scaffold50981_cov23-Tisochrysis_lutea.AAC.2